MLTVDEDDFAGAGGQGHHTGRRGAPRCPWSDGTAEAAVPGAAPAVDRAVGAERDAVV